MLYIVISAKPGNVAYGAVGVFKKVGGLFDAGVDNILLNGISKKVFVEVLEVGYAQIHLSCRLAQIIGAVLSVPDLVAQIGKGGPVVIHFGAVIIGEMIQFGKFAKECVCSLCHYHLVIGTAAKIFDQERGGHFHNFCIILQSQRGVQRDVQPFKISVVAVKIKMNPVIDKMGVPFPIDLGCPFLKYNISFCGDPLVLSLKAYLDRKSVV